MKWIIEGTLVLTMLVLVSCKDERGHQPLDMREVKQDLIEMNRKKAEQESDYLAKYVEEHNWDAEKTGTGVYIMLYDSLESPGPFVKEEQMVSLAYQVSLLDSTVCYSTTLNGPESFVVGMDDVESGLHEAITHLRKGDKARILLPSHRAHGFTGDQKRIPMDAPIIYDVEVIDVR